MGSSGKNPGQGAKPPQAESFFVFGHTTDVQNLPHFLYFANYSVSEVTYIGKNSWAYCTVALQLFAP